MQSQSRQNRNAGRFRGIALSIAGASAVWISVVLGLDAVRFREQAIRTRGTVISLYSGPAHPKIEFEDGHGHLQVFYGGGWISHQVGDRVDVLFDERAPDRLAQLDEPAARWFLPGMFAVLGAAIFSAGAVVLIRKQPHGE